MVKFGKLDPLEKSRGFYIVHCALEYLIAILVSGTFLATLTSELGIADSLTAIISSITSLCCLFQLLSMFIRRGSAKKLSIVTDFIHHVMLMGLFLIPFLPVSGTLRITLFVAVTIVARFIQNVAAPKKAMWLVSLLDHERRGRFGATNEIVSLVLGMVFTYVMSSIIDSYRDAGSLQTCFVICAISIGVLLVLNALAMGSMAEPKVKELPDRDLMAGVRAVIYNKKVLQVAVCTALWSIAQYVSIPFYATFQIKELGYSLKLVSILNIGASVARILVSRLWGGYADKHSFAKMLTRCFMVVAASFSLVCFAGPGIGRWLFAGYTILYAIACGGLGQGMMNLIYEYAPEEMRADAVAFITAFSGVAGFLTTLAVSPIMDAVQRSGNQIFGMTVYAQQIMSVMALVLTVVIIIYIKTAILKKRD